VSNKYLARGDAPFDEALWEALDKTMMETAKRELVGRRLLPVEGPRGLGLKAVPLRDVETESGWVVSEMLPVPLIRKTFTLGMRDLAGFEGKGTMPDLGPVAQAAYDCAQLEDSLMFHGGEGIPGLLTAEGVGAMTLGGWEETGAAAGDIIEAVSRLDGAGFHGPYALALAPRRYNLLFRLYPRGNQSELDHVQRIATEGVFKAPILEDGGVLLAPGQQLASIILGQDMSVGFIGPDGEGNLEFSVSESLTLRILQPKSVCALNG